MPARRSPARTAETVDVTIPAKPEFVSVARLAAAAVAARRSFSYDEIEDLKIAVSEACTALIVQGTAGHPLSLRFILGSDTLETRIETRGPGLDLDSASPLRRPLDESRLGVFLMQCLVDKVEARREQGRAEVRLVKRREQ